MRLWLIVSMLDPVIIDIEVADLEVGALDGDPLRGQLLGLAFRYVTRLLERGWF
jgi:hypothetical protein